MRVRQALLAVFACRSATVHEEAMLAAGALTYACGPQFVKYMERFFPVLQMGLTNHQARPGTRRMAMIWKPVMLWRENGVAATTFVAAALLGA